MNALIDAKTAIQIARKSATEMLNASPFDVEEIERESYSGHDAWTITLSFIKEQERGREHALGAIKPYDPLHYKRLLIDSQTGETLAIKMR